MEKYYIGDLEGFVSPARKQQGQQANAPKRAEVSKLYTYLNISLLMLYVIASKGRTRRRGIQYKDYPCSFVYLTPCIRCLHYLWYQKPINRDSYILGILIQHKQNR